MKEFVTAMPYQSSVGLVKDDELAAEGDNVRSPFIILACDGVWDVLTDQAAVDLIYEKYVENSRQPFEDAAKLLVSLVPIPVNRRGTINARM